MKSPAELKVVLRRQWQNRASREARLLGADGVWPLVLSIGRVSPRLLRTDLDAVRRHIDSWRRVKVGEVIWEAVRYRAADAPVDIPIAWKLRRPSDWIAVCSDDAIKYEFESLSSLVEQSAPCFHSLFIRQRSLWRDKPLAEVVQAARLAMELEPGIATGRPLRTLSLAGIDTKFFERHERLVTALLDQRYDGEVGKMGLGAFLGALSESDHWLLVIDLDGGLLPFRKQRVRSSELLEVELPGQRLLIVENESCQHHLPTTAKTIAVLGSGFNLVWAAGLRRASQRVAYWGDLDTWGLQLVAQARQVIGELDVLMMTAEVYHQFDDLAVPEPVVAGVEAPSGLSQSEQSLYKLLLSKGRGRLEQEFLPEAFVHESILRWASSQSPNRPVSATGTQ